MHIKQVRPIATAGVFDTDRCARSGLKMVDVVASIYTPDILTLKDYYKNLLGEGNIKFQTDDMLVFEMPSGQRILVQQVDDASPFAELKGKQSFGLVSDMVNASNATPVDFGWDESVSMITDPDGNKILLAPPSETKLAAVGN